MADSPSFAKLVPGFDFLEGLVKNAGSALPNIGQWVAPTLNPEELEKRIDELRTVQFWLEQNARMLGATIQALEVQRMTLSTLKTMNVQMEDLRDSLKIRPPEVQAAAATADARPAAKDRSQPAAPPPQAAAVDPMQWWGALTQQFNQLAASAMKNSASANAAGRQATPAKSAPPGTKATKARARKAPARKRAAPKG